MFAWGVMVGWCSRSQRTLLAVAALSPISSSWKKIWATMWERLRRSSSRTTQRTSGVVRLQLPGPESDTPPIPSTPPNT